MTDDGRRTMDGGQGVARRGKRLLGGVGLLFVGVVLARKPEEWVQWVAGWAPNNTALALLASSLPMLAVVGLWVAIARALGTSRTNMLR